MTRNVPSRSGHMLDSKGGASPRAPGAVLVVVEAPEFMFLGIATHSSSRALLLHDFRQRPFNFPGIISPTPFAHMCIRVCVCDTMLFACITIYTTCKKLGIDKAFTSHVNGSRSGSHSSCHSSQYSRRRTARCRHGSLLVIEPYQSTHTHYAYFAPSVLS
jgi:hypothetical protein